jgi:hypothetical protein
MPISHQIDPIRLVRAEAFVFRAPIDVPVRTSFGTMPDRPAVLVRLEEADGACGWGEAWCNFPSVGADHRARLISNVLVPLLLQQSSMLNADLIIGFSSLALAGVVFVATRDLSRRRDGVLYGVPVSPCGALAGR